MKHSTFFALLSVGLVIIILLRFAWAQSPSVNSRSDSSSSSSLNLIIRVSPDLGKQTSSGLYRPYAADTDLRGESTVLFFADDEDPFSVIHETMLRDAALESRLHLLVYKVDFESAGKLKLQYGVVLPDTFVLLNKNAERIQSILHPSDAEFHALLTSSPQ
ncbi:hypothetical protein EXS65_00395 [Candidatus Peribacteria bacterium]|nr:hypothetical protein [Candidatus Peribacteria bacterium]